MLSLARNGYSVDAVRTALHAPVRLEAFRYDLLDYQNNFKAPLQTVQSGNVANAALADKKRIAKFTIRDDGTINFLSDRIKPWYRLKMQDGGWAEFPLGVFLPSTPPRQDDPAGVITRDVEAYDQLQVLADDKVEDRYTVKAGAVFTTEVKNLLTGAGITLYNITTSPLTLPADRDWDPATPKLQIINDLLGAINYRSLRFDADGFAIVEPYVTPDVRAPEDTYADDSTSVILPGVQQALDLFAVPNKWVLVVSQPDRPTLKSVYINSNPNSPTSTVSRGRTIMADVVQVDAADQATLDAMAQRMAYEASQIFEQVTYPSLIMPHHADLDVYTLNYSRLGVAAKYVETDWSFDLQAGATMQHTVRRTVSI